jgi:hypothetical protein
MFFIGLLGSPLAYLLGLIIYGIGMLWLDKSSLASDQTIDAGQQVTSAPISLLLPHQTDIHSFYYSKKQKEACDTIKQEEAAEETRPTAIHYSPHKSPHYNLSPQLKISGRAPPMA